METIAWDESLSIGVPAIDEQHERIIGLLALLVEAAGGNAGHEAMIAAVDSLVEYGARHFSAEEKLIAASGYPEEAAHKRLHQEYTRKVYYLKVGCVEGGCSMAEVTQFLRNWWLTHIKGADMALGKHLKATATA